MAAKQATASATAVRKTKILTEEDLVKAPEKDYMNEAQLAFFRVATAHQDKARRVAHAQAFALDHVLARCSHVDQQIHQMILEEIGRAHV